MRNALLQPLALVLLACVAASCSDRPMEPAVEASADISARTSTSADPVGPRLHAVLRRQFDQSIPNNASTSIAWDVEDADFGDLHTTGATSVTLGPGTWLLIAVVNFQADADGYRGVSIGSSALDRPWAVSSIQGSGSAQTVTATLVASVPAGTTKNYWVIVDHTAGNSLNVLGQRLSYFMVVLLGSEPYAKLRKASHQTIVNNTTTAVTWDVEVADAWNLHSPGGSTVTLAPGFWLLNPLVGWGANASGIRELRIAEDGIENSHVFSSRQGGGSWQATNLPFVRVPQGAPRTYEVRGFQTSGTNVTILGETCGFGFCVRRSHFDVAQLNPAAIGIMRIEQDLPTGSPGFTKLRPFFAEHCPNPVVCHASEFQYMGPGVWLVIAIVNWQANANGIRGVRIDELDVDQGATTLGNAWSSVQGGGGPQSVVLPLLRVVPTGVTRAWILWAQQTSGGSLNVLGGFNTYFIAVQLATL